MKISVGICWFVVNGSGKTVARNAQIDIQERQLGFENCIWQLQCRMKIRD